MPGLSLAVTPLAGRPYDLRHAALTTWLNAGIPPAEVAKRAGNSVEILLRRYAGCLDNQAESVNRRTEKALADMSPEIEHCEAQPTRQNSRVISREQCQTVGNHGTQWDWPRT